MINKGFTLIEVLVALAIVGIIGAISFTGLMTTVKFNDLTLSRMDVGSNVTMTDEILKRDFLHTLNRLTRDERGDFYRHSFYGLNPRFEGTLLAFSINTGDNLPNKNGALRYVEYVFEENKLKRVESKYVDRTEDTEETTIVLLEGIENISVKFAKGDQWEDEWPIADWISNNGLPSVAEVSYEIKGIGNITRLYMLASGEVL